MPKKNFNKTNSKGFTLLELLVVISIIGLLVAIGVASFITAQRKGRDARRKSDVKSIQDGFEQYFSANSNNYATAAQGCTYMFRDGDIFPGGEPTDPKGGPYTYSNCSTSSYCVCAEMETCVGNKASASCTASAGDAYFCLSNLQ